MVREGPVGHSFRIDVLGGEKMTRWEALSMILVIWGVPWGFQNEVKIPSHPSPTPPRGGLGRLGVPFVQPVVASEAFFSHFRVFFCWILTHFVAGL